jgi:hypothetical protein
MAQFPTHLYFESNTEEFHPYETISTPMKLSSSLFINTLPCQHI